MTISRSNEYCSSCGQSRLACQCRPCKCCGMPMQPWRRALCAVCVAQLDAATPTNIAEAAVAEADKENRLRELQRFIDSLTPEMLARLPVVLELWDKYRVGKPPALAPGQALGDAYVYARITAFLAGRYKSFMRALGCQECGGTGETNAYETEGSRIVGVVVTSCLCQEEDHD